MNIDSMYNAKQAADFLGVARTYFFDLKDKHQLRECASYAGMKLYHKRDLVKIKKTLRCATK